MSQQTQVPRVIPKYEAWLEKWPTVFDVAQASRAEILHERVWLGFNRRAINLHEACKKIAYDAITMSIHTNKDDALHHSSQSEDIQQLLHDFFHLDEQKWSSKTNISKKDFFVNAQNQVIQNMTDYAYLRTLPWVWEYTASAICAFGYNQKIPVLDINIKRVLIHSFQLLVEIPLWELQELALSLVPAGKSCVWHNALMDYGSQVLHSKATGIRSAKQSQFKGSDREVRGWILKHLTGKWAMSKMTWNDASIDLSVKEITSVKIATVQAEFSTKDVEKIVAGMVKDGLVRVENEKVVLV